MPLWNCHTVLFCHFTHVIPLRGHCVHAVSLHLTSFRAQHMSQSSQGPLQHVKMHQKCEDTLISTGAPADNAGGWGSWKDPCPPFRRCDLSLPHGLPGREVRALGSAGRLCRNHGCSVATTGQSRCLYSLVKSKDSTDINGKAHRIVGALL